MNRWSGVRSPLYRRLRAAATFGAVAVFALMVLAGARALARSHLTPPPSLASIPPQPAGPDSYAAHVVVTLPPYVPEARVSGVIRIWGHGNPKLPWMQHLVKLWERGFRRFQPGIRLEYRMYGTSSGVPALFTGIGDVAILGEEVLPQELRAFERAKGYRPLVLQVMTGSLDVRNFDYAQQFFVHAGNPLTHITLGQLAAIFGAGQESGDAPIRTWGQLGLRGRWAGQPVRPYGWALDDSFAVYLQQALLGGSHEWSCALRQYRHIYQPDGGIYDHGQQILDALAQDPDGIAVSNIRYAGPEVRPLALGIGPDGPFYQATERTLIEGLYPLARALPAVVDVPPGGRLDPKVREFLRYLLSRQGQGAVNEDGRYLPLAATLLQAQLRKLPPAAPAMEVRPAPAAPTPGVLRVWGPPAMAAVVARWASGFHRLHPGLTVAPRLVGSDTAIPGLYSGRADIALLGRRDDGTDDNGFSRPKGYRFTSFKLMNGSLATPGQSPALAVLVSRDNPLSRLTVGEVRRIASCSCGPDAATALTWGELGAKGDWASRPVHLYLMNIDSGTGAYFLRAVMGGSAALDWQRVREFDDTRGVDGSMQTAAAFAAAALRRDPDGIAVSNARYAGAGLKLLAIAARSPGPFVLPSRESIVAGRYPLARGAYAFIDRAPGKAMDPRVQQFLQYVLSPAGQADVRRAGGYLPLGPNVRAKELGALSGAGSPADYALEVAASLPAYRPREQVSGTIRLWGHGSPKHDFLGNLLRRWERDFQRYQPHVRIVDDMYGSASGVGALYTGAGDLAILGEEVSPAAKRAFVRERHYAPTTFEIATGNVAVNYYDYAHMVFVNRANPLDRLTLPQLARILGDPPSGRGSGPIRTWGELGLTGSWARRRIQPYSWRFDQDFGLFLRARVLGGSGRFNPAVREFVTYERPDGTSDDRGEQILQALARDPNGIAVSNIRFANSSVKLVKLAASSSEPYVLPTVATLISQRYPLTRIIPAVVDVAPGQPLDPAIREFLRFILSRDGQRALVAESGYLPLGARYVRAQLRKLDELSRCRAANGCRPGTRRDHALTALQKEELASSPGHPPERVIRVWGNPDFQPLAQRWAQRFRAGHRQDRIALHMTGNDTGMAGLYTGEADIALLGRAATDSELQAFEWVFRRPPACTEIAARDIDLASQAPRGRSFYVYLDAGPGAQPEAPAFLQYILSQGGRTGHRCAPTR
ncbi:MAG TPA: substrate-binding domain-containing protein [Steroidobacteraceae bacterium]|nr:substrate-binding domain-containing protein [Steroidobacteraceae bacterium]